ncbi:hypothetical protein DFH29DRAFT_248355 [Suillus ampliporus]|nr:hypothetical protein DFH29DRAFT_248355 [Suillus ampliporus]
MSQVLLTVVPCVQGGHSFSNNYLHSTWSAYGRLSSTATDLRLKKHACFRSIILSALLTIVAKHYDVYIRTSMSIDAKFEGCRRQVDHPAPRTIQIHVPPIYARAFLPTQATSQTNKTTVSGSTTSGSLTLGKHIHCRENRFEPTKPISG